MEPHPRRVIRAGRARPLPRVEVQRHDEVVLVARYGRLRLVELLHDRKQLAVAGRRLCRAEEELRELKVRGVSMLCRQLRVCEGA